MIYLFTYLGYLYLGFIALRFIIVFINLISRPYLTHKNQLKTEPKISVLIPARNEEENIGRLIDALLVQTYKPFEIIVYNDDSSDATAQILQEISKRHGTVKIIEGKELPKGWLGKNHACFQLAQKANGAFYLFLDADVLPANNLIERALTHVTTNNLQLLSLFPQQEMESVGERLVVPLMHNILLSMLPLFYVICSNRPSLAAANGQFMFFEAKTYNKIKPHSWVKNSPVEDIRIVKLFKKFNYRCETLLGNGFISCRMYKSFGESIHGFSKNIQSFFGESKIFMMFYVVLSLVGVGGLLYLSSRLVVVALLLLFSYHTMLNKLAGRNFFMIFLVPLQTLSAFWIAVISIVKFNKGKLEWKGRKITQ